MDRTSKAFFTELEAEPFVEDLAIIWPKRIAQNWFWLGFQALEKSGLTYYESEQEEIMVRERLNLLVIFYYEFCHISAMHESENFIYRNHNVIDRLKSEIPNNGDDLLFEIRIALIKYFGGEEKVLAELWINCLEGSTSRFLKIEDKIQLYEKIVNIKYENENVNYSEVRNWFTGGLTGVSSFESIAT